MSKQEYIVFSLSGEEFGLEIKAVREIVESQKIVKLPQSSGLLRGIICLREEVIPVVDLRKHFYDQTTENPETKQIIIFDLVDCLVGILVDNVIEVLALPSQMIVPLPSFLGQMGVSAGLHGIGRLSGRLIILLKLTDLFNSQEKNLFKKSAKEGGGKR